MQKFELNRVYSYDENFLLAELRRVADLIKEPYILATDFDKYSKASSSTVCRKFGGWQQALTKAGLEKRFLGRGRNPTQIFSDEQMLAELKAVATKAETIELTKEIFSRHSQIFPRTIAKRFGSWREALKKAGLSVVRSGRRYSEDKCFENLLTVWNYYGRQPNVREINGPPSKIKVGTYRRRWGTWKKALHAFSDNLKLDGQSIGESKFAIKFRSKSKKYSDEQLLAELKAVAKRAETVELTQEIFSRHSPIPPRTIAKRFGSWPEALNKADLSNSKCGGKRYSTEDCFNNLLTVWTHYGRQPKFYEMDQSPSQILARVYERRWGNWTKACLAFIERMNQDASLKEAAKPESKLSNSKSPAKKRTTRDIPVGLRYKVLKRDNFRCVKCGRSPATHSGVILHVDHILPWSKDGETVFENLQTKCSDCNLGKGAQIE